MPQHSEKARVLSPVSYIPSLVYETDPKRVTRLYHLPEKFVYVPNQFWKHKNHITAFRALKILKSRGIDLFLVCTGNPVDYRHPGHFSELLQQLSQWNIREQTAILGLVPRDHVFALMRQSICVLNPSLFEGFGLSVDEARSLGKQVVVSSIPAHREQNPPQAVYFNPQDSEELANKLAQVWQQKLPGPDVTLELEARETLLPRLRSYGQSFGTILQEVANQSEIAGMPGTGKLTGEVGVAADQSQAE